MEVFVDSSVFCAYANESDVHHTKASGILKKLVSEKYKLIITDYVFDETLTAVLHKTDKKIAAEFGKYILNSEFLIGKVSQPIFQKAWELFCKGNRFSFTDCTIVAFMETFGINKIATFDKEFKKIKDIKVISNIE